MRRWCDFNFVGPLQMHDSLFHYVNIADDTRGASRLCYCEVNIENRYLISYFNDLWENFSNITGEVFKG